MRAITGLAGLAAASIFSLSDVNAGGRFVTGDTSCDTHRRYALRARGAASARRGVECRKISIFSASHCGSVRGGLPDNASSVPALRRERC